MEETNEKDSLGILPYVNPVVITAGLCRHIHTSYYTGYHTGYHTGYNYYGTGRL